MTTMNTTALRRLFYSGLVLMLLGVGCERAVDGLNEAEYSTNPDVFIDTFSAGFGGSVPAAFQVDTEVTYNNSTASMRFEVPDAGDPRGAYAGGTFFTSTPRNLSGYNALTFWAKASQSVVFNEVGLGNDLGANRFIASVSGFTVNSNWRKYIIPLPDPSSLNAERGMFYYAAGPIDGKGYTIWVDHVKYERLETIAHPRHTILNGQDQTITSFNGITNRVEGLSSVFNMPDGLNRAVGASPNYFQFSSSNPAVATVDANGNVTTVSAGSTVITATLGGVQAEGSLTIQSQGNFSLAPDPTFAANDVISLFSDVYTNAPVDYYNGYWAPHQTTQSADFTINGNNILNYTNFNFVGIQFSTPTINATSMTHLRMNLYFPNPIAPGTQFRVELRNFGPNGVYDESDDDTSHKLTFTAPTIATQTWITLDIPLANFTGLNSRANLGQLIFEGVNVSNFYVDNIIFRR